MSTAPQQAARAEAFKYIVEHPEVACAERCKRSLYEFVQEFWPYVAKTRFHANWHIEYICNEVQRVFERVGRNETNDYDLVINVPPGSTKTLIVSIMAPAWAWTNWAWMQFICTSYGDKLALKNANFSRDIIRSEKYQQYYPDLQIKEDDDTKSNFFITYTNEDGGRITGGNRFSTSVGGAVTGFHAHVILIDDPLKPDEAVSEVKLENANTYCDQTLSTRKVDNRVTTTILIMQRLAEEDPAGKMLKRKSAVKHICLPGEVRGGYAQYVRPIELINRYVDGLLDPVRLDEKELAKKEEVLGQTGYAGQIGQNPSPPEGDFFDVTCFNYIDALTEVDRMNIVKSVRYWDKAGTKGGRGARTSGVLMHRTRDNRFIVEDVITGRWKATEREEHIERTAEEDGVQVHVIVEQEPGSGGLESADATVENLSDFMASKDRPRGDKGYRAEPWAVKIKRGHVYLMRGRWNTEYVDEHRHFHPDRAGVKDQVDASSGAHIFLTKLKQVRSLRTRRRG